MHKAKSKTDVELSELSHGNGTKAGRRKSKLTQLERFLLKTYCYMIYLISECRLLLSGEALLPATDM